MNHIFERKNIFFLKSFIFLNEKVFRQLKKNNTLARL
jgi:hypothetical protein